MTVETIPLETDKPPEQLYAERVKRVEDAVALRQPDRVPVSIGGRYFAARQAGMTCRQAMYDTDALSAATRAAHLKYQPDFCNNPHRFMGYGPAMDIVDPKAIMWPGHGVDEDRPFQYLDKEFMGAEEYDAFLLDPTGYYLETYLPRVAGAMGGFARIPTLPMFPNNVVALSEAFVDPELAETLRRMAEAGAQLAEQRTRVAAYVAEMEALGFPNFGISAGSAPFDQIADFMRGAKGAMLDMYRRPDKLLAAAEKQKAFVIKRAISGAGSRTGGHVIIPLHWGLDGFMSVEQFKTFYWPTLRDLTIAIIDAGLVPSLFWEGTVESRLEIIADIPPGKAIYKFERTDLFKAKEVLGDVVCLQGNVPASLLNAGTPADVDAYCRRLIETVGKGGGFILDGAASIPDEARAENVAAMAASVRKYQPKG